MTIQLRAVVYSRVSTDAQAKDGTSLDTQERALQEYVEANGWIPIESIRDTSSGSTLDRPGIERLRLLLRQGAVDVVVAYAVDRLSRHQNHIGVLFDEVEQAGAQLQFITEDFEDTAIGRFILAARAFTGEVEREKIAERTMRGKAERARSGKIPQGTGKGIFGYRYNQKTGQREIDDVQSLIVRRIFERFCSGDACNRIAVGLNRDAIPAFSGNKWHPLTIRRMLMNETYTGRTIYRKTRAESIRSSQDGKKHRRVVTRPESEWIDVPGATPAIVSPDTFEAAQKILSDPQRRLVGRPTRHYRLRGRIRCLSCGTPMVGQALGKGRYVYYRCRRSYAGSFEATCDSKYVPVAPLERTVLEQVVSVLSNPARILAEVRHLNGQEIDETQAKGISNEIAKIEDQQRRLADLYINGSLPQDILDSKSQILSRDRLRLEAESRALATPQSNGLDLNLIEKTLPDAAARIKEWVIQASDEDMELILRGLDIQIRASGEEVQIEGSVPVLVEEDGDLVTIAQTSGWSRVDAYAYRDSLAWVLAENL
jgi:site-specific DNA recombinase